MTLDEQVIALIDKRLKELGVLAPGKTRDGLRVAAKMSRPDLANKSGVSLPTVLRAERGQQCRYVCIEKIARALHVSPDQYYNASPHKEEKRKS